MNEEITLDDLHDTGTYLVMKELIEQGVSKNEIKKEFDTMVDATVENLTDDEEN